MDLQLVFLGTAGGVPTVDRGLPAVLLIRGGERILIDCGEGTQRQLMRSAGLARISTILLTHLHGDHFLGLPGLLKTFSLLGRTEPLYLFGPPGLYEFLHDAERLMGRTRFPLLTEEVAGGTARESADYELLAQPVDHSIPSISWALREKQRPGLFHPEVAASIGVVAGPDFGRLQRGEAISLPDGTVVRPEDVMEPERPGRTIVITGDTRPSPALTRFATGATVLVHESTFSESESERAFETKHSAAGEAATVALEAQVGLLVLTHLSSRHGWRELRDEARKIFPNTVLPRDFDVLVVPYPDKGRATLVFGRDVMATVAGPNSAQSV
jgi:ribonuclease Z